MGADNTYLVFTADHGLAMGKHGLLGKQSLYDHSVRAPFIILGPDISKGKKVTADIYIQDAMATALHLANDSVPKNLFFNTVLPMAKGEISKSTYPEIYGSYVDYQRMIRKDGYKLMVFPKLGKVLLFDLEKDPEEMQNLSTLPEHRTKVTQLFSDLQALQKKMKDPLDLSEVLQKFKQKNNLVQ